jgi:hypothetical protein
MYDPAGEFYAPLGAHLPREADALIYGLRDRIMQEGHLLTFSDLRGPRTTTLAASTGIVDSADDMDELLEFWFEAMGKRTSTRVYG